MKPKKSARRAAAKETQKSLNSFFDGEFCDAFTLLRWEAKRQRLLQNKKDDGVQKQINN